MKSIKLSLLYGFLLWLIPFVVASVIIPLRESQSPLFETIMPISLTTCVVFFSVLYFGKMESGFLSESIKLGIIWFGMCVVIDLFFFTWGPMKMPFINYMEDIGFTYLIFPLVAIGFGYMLERRLSEKSIPR